MTKTIIIDSENVKPKVDFIPIKFDLYLNASNTMSQGHLIPSNYKFIELIAKDYTKKYDLMFAYSSHERRENGTLYLGKWNDGVVE